MSLIAGTRTSATMKLALVLLMLVPVALAVGWLFMLGVGIATSVWAWPGTIGFWDAVFLVFIWDTVRSYITFTYRSS